MVMWDKDKDGFTFSFSGYVRFLETTTTCLKGVIEMTINLNEFTEPTNNYGGGKKITKEEVIKFVNSIKRLSGLVGLSEVETSIKNFNWIYRHHTGLNRNSSRGIGAPRTEFGKLVEQLGVYLRGSSDGSRVKWKIPENQVIKPDKTVMEIVEKMNKTNNEKEKEKLNQMIEQYILTGVVPSSK